MPHRCWCAARASRTTSTIGFCIGGATVGTFPRMERFRPLTHEVSVAGPLRTLSGLAALALSNHTGAPLLDFLTRGASVFHASVLVRHPPKRVRLTATVHDLTGFLMPELHSPANLAAEGSFAQLARRADGLIAVSEFTRQDAIRTLGIAPEKICTIHSGVADSFFDRKSTRLNSSHLGISYAV